MTMRLDLTRFRSATEKIERHFEAADFGPPSDDFVVAGPVDLVGDVSKDGRKFRLQARLTARIECPCSRCLEPFPMDIDTTIDLHFLPVANAALDVDREATEDDFGVSYYQDDEIDLGDVIREQFYLALPMKPLCRPDCLGLCPTCGINRNRATCACKDEWVDPRLEALKRFKHS